MSGRNSGRGNGTACITRVCSRTTNRRITATGANLKSAGSAEKESEARLQQRGEHYRANVGGGAGSGSLMQQTASHLRPRIPTPCRGSALQG